MLCTLALLALVNLHLYFLRLIGKGLVGAHHRLRLYELLCLLRFWIEAVFMRSNRAFSGILTGCVWKTSKNESGSLGIVLRWIDSAFNRY